jgi:lipoprotein signal peptidase
MKKGKYFLLFLCSLVILQLVDYLFYKANFYQINTRFLFGYIGNNLIAVFVAVIFLILFYLVIPKSKTTLLFIFLSSAVLSNIVDRIFYSGVIDYIKIWFIPTFNLADIVIVASVILVSFQMIRKKIQ